MLTTSNIKALAATALNKPMETICFDVETGGVPEAELASMVSAFDPAQVKVGNIKDPEKIAASYREGILEVEVPKREEAKPKHIKIEVK